MIGKNLWATISTSSVLAFILCGPGFANEADVTVYGGPRCSVSKQLMLDLDARQIPYQYVDISTRSGQEAMQQEFFEHDINGSVQTPVVNVNGHFVASQNFISTEQVLNALALPPVTFESYSGDLVAEIYGEEGDQGTQRLITALEARDLPYEFYNLNTREVLLELSQRLREKGISSYYTPTTFINGEMFMGNDSHRVLDAYQ